MLEQGLKAAVPNLRQQAALTAQEERVRILLQERDNLSDETITFTELENLGFRSFSEILPILERLEAADLAHRLPQDDAAAFEAIPLPPTDADRDTQP